MQTTKIPLKYLFTATYKDGRVYQQTAEDRSLTEPDKRSCFFDIAGDVDKLNIASFVLKGDGHEYKVDLIDGHFEIDGKEFFMHDGHLHYTQNNQIGGRPRSAMMALSELRLGYFRRDRDHFELGESINRGLSQEVMYRIGWQAKSSCGHTEERIMQFK